jgi:hypothetical protein
MLNSALSAAVLGDLCDLVFMPSPARNLKSQSALRTAAESAELSMTVMSNSVV